MQNTLTSTWQNKVREFAAQSEALGELHPEILDLAYKENWFKLFVPQIYGGAGKKLPEILHLEEELAEADGSLGWTVTLCAGAAWFAGFLDQELAKEIFSEREVCFAGSGAVGGTAVQMESGYLINGHWKYASGALHATVFTANCTIKKVDGTDLLDEDGNPEVISFILKKNEVEILSGWSYFGLIATGSHAFEVKDLLVPVNRTFKINSDIKVADQGFDYPFLQLAETTLAVNSLGMGRHFIRLVEDSFFARSGLSRYNDEQVAFFTSELNGCKTEVESLRNQFYTTFDQSWDQLIQNGSIQEDQLQMVSRISRKLAHACRRAADTLFPYGGLEAAKKESEINRVWRDIHTASQHALLTFEN
ncbi:MULTISPECIES: acyl-CoA dehydrogenase family protein [unclassified Pedobacter]|uniref:acyl-CoA dehydrogenase family protein n=1 Tax=unclassified Pedobacter TaxID=2628915 RepID=UPI000B4BB2AC|nr:MULTISPECIES: acyl-CoA dehydrogenase family protein [unclassified Pedobacter]MCX2584892.1 acyl-CoA dehydrogenase [Pedobacter sp. MR22-3]OWK71907.1 acyl-CoA dehydrogenase [Pedobacter sp. AJM]